MENENLQFQKVGEHVNPNNWLYTMKVKKPKTYDQTFIGQWCAMQTFWVPMHQLRMFKHLPFITNENISDTIYNSCISIPSSTSLTDAQVEEVVRVVKAF
ncbi:MAG: DegT/DnrJ/EryC1/StrS family aminotransferase [Saprospiraceae bacterium]|nr:DegT/DnrJ/EryC1/StrS family aminotransferase [Saprospiraceae bacterium]